MGYLQIKILKVSVLSGAVAGLIWLLWPTEGEWQFEWWPFWTTLSGFAAFAVAEWREAVRVTKMHCLGSVLTEHDVYLIGQLRSLLPSDGKTMRFFSENDLGNSFDSGVLRDAERFAEEWKDPERSLHDSELESLKEELRHNVSEFLHELAPNIGPEVGGGRLSVIPPEHLGDFDIPERFLNAVSKLNDMASAITRKHNAFLTACNKKVAEREKALLIQSNGLV